MNLKLFPIIKKKIKPYIHSVIVLFVREFIKLRYGTEDYKEKKIENINKNEFNFTPLTRNKFFSYLSPCYSILEIGAFDRPSLDSLDDDSRLIHYADYLSKEELINRAKKIPGRDISNIPEIKYVLSKGYSQIKIKYDAVISNHCIEHVPDLIVHLNQIYRITKGQGAYLFSVPDKRLCFDHFFSESTILDVLTAHLEKRKKPVLQDVLKHYLFTSHNWVIDKDPLDNITKESVEKINEISDFYQSSPYVDVHCWHFTPNSLSRIINQLSDLKYINKPKSIKIFPSGEGTEFYVALNYSDKVKL